MLLLHKYKIIDVMSVYPTNINDSACNIDYIAHHATANVNLKSVYLLTMLQVVEIVVNQIFSWIYQLYIRNSLRKFFVYTVKLYSKLHIAKKFCYKLPKNAKISLARDWMNKYRKRLVDTILEEKLLYSGAVLIEGAKWCGKTTTAKQSAKSSIFIDDIELVGGYISQAEINPSILLKGDTPRLIDEWQLAPQLWDVARREIDRRQSFGNFIFTGSSVPADSTKIFHSGTGRFAWLKMRTMSLFESNESTGDVSLGDLFNATDNISGVCKFDINNLAYQICRGGWPQSIDLPSDIALKISTNYYDALINSDINRVDGISKNPERVKRLMRSFSRNLCAQTSINTILNDVKESETINISDETIYRYINALKNMFVIEDMPSWNPNLRSKTATRTSDTRYFTDPSIACAALGICPDDLINDLNTFGLMFENLCVRDLRVYSQSLDASVYHYRDANGLECDSVIHKRNGSYGLVEIKLGGEKLIEEGAKNLLKLEKIIDTSKMKAPSFLMIIVGVGQYAYKRKDGICVVPIGCLRN